MGKNGSAWSLGWQRGLSEAKTNSPRARDDGRSVTRHPSPLSLPYQLVIFQKVSRHSRAPCCVQQWETGTHNMITNSEITQSEQRAIYEIEQYIQASRRHVFGWSGRARRH